MKSKALEKAVAAAREQAQILEEKARQSGRAARSAKDRLRQAKASLKLAKEEANHARKAAKAAKRASADAMDASEDAAAVIAALEKRFQAAEGASAPVRAKSGKPKKSRARKARPGTRATTSRSKKMESPPAAEVPADFSMTIPLIAALQPDPGSMEVLIEVPTDIAVSTDVFSGSPAPGDAFAPPLSETSSQ